MPETSNQLLEPKTVRSATKAWRPRHRLAAFIIVLLVGAASGLISASPAQAGYVGTNYLRNWATGRCLDSNAAGNVYTLPCNLPVGSNRYQTWEPIFTKKIDGFDLIQLKNVATGRCLYFYPGTSVYTTLPCPGANNLTSVAAGVYWFVEGTPWYQVRFESFGGLGRCLDSNSNGNVYGLGCNSGGYQFWRFGY
ncbi:RICIN domain-containing protein [Rhizomonospora bruguierae]|uniref:RICIN domain-containing protein n=1 Tax=Rhizomonospora bruguierae TaxID=1581705 RepID=UPI001BCCD80C|nr:hypothetical protein [Micromonospora sp. NBRC 107566]